MKVHIYSNPPRNELTDVKSVHDAMKTMDISNKTDFCRYILNSENYIYICHKIKPMLNDYSEAVIFRGLKWLLLGRSKMDISKFSIFLFGDDLNKLARFINELTKGWYPIVIMGLLNIFETFMNFYEYEVFTENLFNVWSVRQIADFCNSRLKKANWNKGRIY